MAYGLALQQSSNIWIYGTGLYAFFETWSQTCLNVLPTLPTCQEQMIYNYCSHNIYAYAVSTYGAINMLSGGQSYSLATQNGNTFCSTVIVDLNLF
jgi:glucan 1,3-beta-glucosidase